MLRDDVKRLIGRRPRTLTILKHIVTDSGVLSIALLRLQSKLYNRKLYLPAKLIRMLNISLTGADFCLGCVIGKGLIIRHSNGIVVGGLSVIGENCTLLQQVTLGERDGDGSDHNHSNPIVGNGVTISAGAKLIGGIVVGDNAIIGANAVVLQDVPPNTVAVGIPARIIAKKSVTQSVEQVG
ncbi:serine O-acetyltransferase EpsC [Cohnella lupini]|uniref:Serine acetyltransferase n=1 Tax=Cohnella lupini TaxID=1294267 RepID=A0A3D9I1L2_9BACL|nr:serine O-acetyltransferase EpsC [Cohnella lupini]RED55561.1 serine O-acetyltransferase [Cohnella lupini]